MFKDGKLNQITTLLIAILGIFSQDQNITAQVSSEDSGFLSVMPKRETQALQFLEKNPDYDGSGVIVAVLDTGVDPTANGLRLTPGGETKVIDIIDATGSGDVDMSHTVKSKNDSIKGIRGNTLLLDPKWKNPTSEFNVGIKLGYEVFPGPAISNYKRKQKEERALKTRQRVREIEQKLVKTDLTNNEKKELNERIKQLNNLQISFDPPSPIYDCITFFDGSRWAAVVDTNGNNDLRDEQLLYDFDFNHDLASLSPELGVNFGVHIYDNGKTLSIISESGAHGTHVAGIISGYFPNTPEFNGVAPGAKIVSIKIGDNRLGTMETMTAMERALTAVVRHKCDLINMSYGEPTTLPDKGRITELIHHTVREDNVIFVASAGNAGPALYTVGSPGGTTGPALGIGAYISPAMVKEQYAIPEEISEGFYTWSSRGPTFDGDSGVDFAAPGGAYAPVPQWSGTSKQQMNGTSMAAPNACGNIALILSGLKANGLSYTPAKIERALSSTARLINNASRFAQGRGLIQTLDAYEKLIQFGNDVTLNTPIDIRVSDADSPRGIQLFLEPKNDFNKDYRVSLIPWFSKSAPLSRKVDFQKTVTFKSKFDWITVPSKAIVLSGGATINIKINLKAEEIESLGNQPFLTDIEVYETESENFGAVARIPITVIKSSVSQIATEPSNFHQGGGAFNTGDIERTYLTPPNWAQWIEIKYNRTNGADDKKRFVFHAVQKIAGRNYRHHEKRNYISLGRNKLHTIKIPVVGGVPIELALAPYWSESETVNIEWQAQFFGNKVHPNPLVIDGTQGLTQITIHPSPDSRDRTIIAPNGSLDKLRRTLTPVEASISPLLEKRDQLVNGGYAYELITKYDFSLSKATTIKPILTAFQDRLYESEFSSQIWEIRNESGESVYSDDTWPDSVRLDAGQYKLLFHFRHPNPKQLEKIKNSPLALEMPVKNTSVKFYKNPDDFLTGKGGSIGRTIKKSGSPIKFYAGIPFGTATPSIAKPGDLLVGEVSWIKDDTSTVWEESNPKKTRIVYTVPLSDSENKIDTQKDKFVISSNDGIEKTVRNTRLAFLKSIDKEDNQRFNKIYQSLIEMDPDWIEVIYTKLLRLDDENRKLKLDEIVKIAELLISKIDQDQLAKILNIPESFLSEAEKALKKSANHKRAILTDTLYRQARAIAYQEDQAKLNNPDDFEYNPSFDVAFKALQKWGNTRVKDFILVHIRHLRRMDKQAQGLALLNPYLKTTRPEDKKYHLKKLRLLEELGWKEWISTQQDFININYPINPTIKF